MDGRKTQMSWTLSKNAFIHNCESVNKSIVLSVLTGIINFSTIQSLAVEISTRLGVEKCEQGSDSKNEGAEDDVKKQRCRGLCKVWATTP